MPVLDGDFEAFVTNLGKYNEGELVGEWVKFPTTEEELKKVFERIGIGAKDSFGNTYEEWFITDYECPVNGVYQMLGEYESLDKLNYLAALIDELSKDEQEKLVAIMNGGCDQVSDIDDLINLTFNLDTYDFIPSVHDDEDLGYYYLHDAGIYSEKDLVPFANYIDYERYGRDVRFEEGGSFTDERGRLVVDDVYNGFDDDTMEQLRWEVLPVSKLPDPTISTDEMKAYGYAWGGMLPMKAETAKEVISSCEIFRLYSDNTEGLVLDAKDIEDHAAKGGIFGVSKADWQALTERENPLKAAEISTEDDYGMIDGIINNGAKDTAEKAEKSSIMDRLKSSKSEPQTEKPQPHKERKSEHEL
jgi:antirestriction protein